MSIIVSKNEVCNMALSRLKIPPITNIDAVNKTEIERLLTLWYDQSRREILRSHSWNFAKSRAKLSLSTTDPIFGYPDKYLLPSGFLRLLYIGDEQLGLIEEDYQIEEDKYLLINNGGGTSLDVGYIKDETNVAKFDALALKCLALTIADNIAYGVLGKNNIKKEVKQDLMDANILARAVNGQDKPPVRVTRSSVLGARRKYGTGSSGLRNQDDMLI